MFVLLFQTGVGGKKKAWHLKYRNLIDTLDIRLKEIVLADYLGNKSHVNFAKFFISNARVLESVTLELLLKGGNRTIILAARGLKHKIGSSRSTRGRGMCSWILYLVACPLAGHLAIVVSESNYMICQRPLL